MRRTPGILWGLLLLSGIGLLALFTRGGAATGESASSYEPEGRVALLGLLGALDFRAELWSEAPGDLPRGGALLWLGRAPEPPPGYAQGAPDASGPRVGVRRTRDLLHYTRFVEEGGSLILPDSEEARVFLRETLGLEGLDELTAFEGTRSSPVPVTLATGEELLLDCGVGFERPRSGHPWEPVAASLAGEVGALRTGLGRGNVVLLAADSLLDNESIGDHDNALFAVRLAEAFAPGRRVLFDEFALGGWEPPSPLELLFTGRLAPAAYQALLLGLLLILALFARREFPRDPEPLEQLSPLSRVRGAAALLERAGRYGGLAAQLRDGVAERLARRARARGLVREGGTATWKPREIELLRRGLSLPAESRDEARWKHAFLGRLPQTRSELEAFDALLRSVEAESASRWNGPHEERV